MKNMNIEKLVIQIHKSKRILGLLKLMPSDAEFIAVNRHKCGSIFFKQDKGKLFADFKNGQGWSLVQQQSVDELTQDLQAMSFFLARIDLLNKEIEIENALSGVELKKFEALEQQLLVRIELTQLRCDADGNDLYWKAHAEAYEVVKHMMREINEYA